MKQKLTELKGEIDNSTTIVRDFNTPVSAMNRNVREKKNKKVEDLNNTKSQLDLRNR